MNRPSLLCILSACCMAELALHVRDAAAAPRSTTPQEAPSARAPLPPPHISPEMRKADPRLEKPVTLKIRLAPMGEITAEIARQTGVRVTAFERDGAADEPLAMHCPPTPLYRILNGLWSTMSYQGGEWRWERSGEPGSYIYRLVQPGAARRLRQRLRDEVENKLERDVNLLIGALNQSDERKAAVVREIYGEHEIGFEKYHAFSEERLWHDIGSFRDALSERQRSAILRGTASAKLSISKVSPPARAYYERIAAGIGRGKKVVFRNDGSPPMEVELSPNEYLPTEIWFERTTYSGTPALRIVVPNATTGMPVVGGIPMTEWFWKQMEGLWQLEGDAKESPLEDRVMEKPADAKPEPSRALPRRPDGSTIPFAQSGLETHVERRARYFEHLAEGAKVPVIARLPQDFSMLGVDLPWGKTIKEFFKDDWRRDLMHKWHDGVLIASIKSWPLEDPPVPVTLLRQVRENAEPGKLLPLDDLLSAAGTLTRSQLLRLEKEFPAMKQAAEAQPFFAFLHRLPVLAREAMTISGLPLNARVFAEMRAVFPEELMEKLEEKRAAVLRVGVNGRAAGDRPTRQIDWTFDAADGSTVHTARFKDVPQPKPRLPEKKPE